MSIADKIIQLTTIRGDIRTALAGKGVTATDHDYADFAADIGSISGAPLGMLKGAFYDGNLLEGVEYLLPSSGSADIVSLTGKAYSLTPNGRPITFPYSISADTNFYKSTYTSILNKTTPNFITNVDGSALTKIDKPGRGVSVQTTQATTSFGRGTAQVLYVNTNPNTFWKLSAGCDSAYNSAAMWGPIDVSEYSTINIVDFECNDGVGWGACGFGFCTSAAWDSSQYRGANSLEPYAYYRNRGIAYYKEIYGSSFTVADVLGNESHPAWETLTVDVSNLNSVYFWVYIGDGEFAIKDIYLT